MFQLIVLFSTVVVIAASNSPKVSPDELRAKWALMAKDLKARQEEVKLKIRNLQEPLREKVAEAKNKLSSVVSDIHQNLQAGVIGIEERPLGSKRTTAEAALVKLGLDVDEAHLDHKKDDEEDTCAQKYV
ncbi:hypothetical protein YQE_08292, partial [Dendroctonus ponderosae]